MTHFMNNLSSLFPYGEKFFVDSVRAVRDQVSDPQLLMRKDGQLFNWRSWARGLKTLLGPRNGYFPKMIKPYLNYYRPGFHPFDHGTRTLEKRWKERLGFNG